MLTPTQIIRQAMRAPTRRPSRPREPAPTLEPEQERSVAGSIADKGLAGVSAVGNLLDLPGSMVRDTLSLQNPLDQLLSPLSAKNRVTGREMNRNLGLAGKKDTWGNFGGGLATEIALDPLTYLTLGASAAGKGGQIAKAAGLMDDAGIVAAKKLGTTAGKVGTNQARTTATLQDLIQHGGQPAQEAAERAAAGLGIKIGDVASEPLGGLIKARGPMRLLMGSDPIGGARGAKRIDDLKRWFQRLPIFPKSSFRPFNEMRRNFDAQIKEATTAEGQAAGKRFHARQGKSIAQARFRIAELTNDLERMGLASPGQGKMLRQVFEDPKVRSAMPAEVRDWADGALGDLAEILPRAQEYGINLRELVDPMIDYFPRYISQVSRKGGKSRVISAMDPSKLARLDFLREIPEGTRVISEIAEHPQINQLIEAGSDTRTIADALRQNFSGRLPDEFRPIQSVDDAGTATYGEAKDRFQAMAKWLKGLSKETRESGIFGNHPLVDMQARLQGAKQSIDAGHTLFETLAQKGILKRPEAAGEGAKTVAGLFEDAGIVLGSKERGGLNKLAQMMGQDLSALPDDAAESVMQGLKEMAVDADLGADLTRFMRGFAQPESLNPIMQVTDDVTNLFKAGVTSPWPAFHIRNLTSGQWRNYVAGMFGRKSVMQAKDLMRGNAIEGSSKWKWVQDEWARRNPVQSRDEFVRNAPKASPDVQIAFDKLAKQLKDEPAGWSTGPVSREIRAPAKGTPGYGFEPTYERGTPLPESASDNVVFRDDSGTAVGILHIGKDQAGNPDILQVAVSPSHRRQGIGTKLFEKAKEKYPDIEKASGRGGYTTEGAHLAHSRRAKSGPDLSGLTDKEATKLLGEAAYANQVAGRFQGEQFAQAGQAASQAGGSIDDITQEMLGVGRKRMSVRGTAGKLATRELSAWNPVNIRGVGGRTKTGFAPAQVGEDIGNAVEGFNRLSPWLHEVQKGVDPTQAARKVGAAQVEYGGRHYTTFEREAMARAFPFYKFTRQNIPYVLETLSTKPGGKMAQTIRTINRSRNPDEVTPEYVSSTASVPLEGVPLIGGAPEGTKRYLTGFGLMMEDPLELMGGQNPMLQALGRANPLAKGPLEWATGQSFFQTGPVGGRPLEDLDPTLGRTARNVQQLAQDPMRMIWGGGPSWSEPVKFPGQTAIEHVLGNSPIARFLTSTRTATDPRKDALLKGLNLGTGFRITDVSPAAQDAVLREAAQRVMRQMGAKEFTSTYFPKDKAASLPSDKRVELGRLQALLATLRQRAQERSRD